MVNGEVKFVHAVSEQHARFLLQRQAVKRFGKCLITDIKLIDTIYVKEKK